MIMVTEVGIKQINNRTWMLWTKGDDCCDFAEHFFESSEGMQIVALVDKIGTPDFWWKVHEEPVSQGDASGLWKGLDEPC
jgi:hypothetical protein